jgi:hypothetical protein
MVDDTSAAASPRAPRRALSATLEAIAVQQGLEVERLDPTMLLVVAATGPPAAFLGWIGPSTGRPALRLCRSELGVRTRLARAGLPLTELAIHSARDPEAGWAAVEGARCVVSGAELDDADRRVVAPGDHAGFLAAWHRAARTGRFVAVERIGDARDVQVFVVDGSPFAAVEQREAPFDAAAGAHGSAPSAIPIDPGGAAAVVAARAIGAIPGLVVGTARLAVTSRPGSEIAVQVRGIDVGPPTGILSAPSHRDAAEALLRRELGPLPGDPSGDRAAPVRSWMRRLLAGRPGRGSG